MHHYKNKPEYFLDIATIFTENEMIMRYMYSSKHYKKNNIQKFSKHFQETLSLLIDICYEFKVEED